MHFLCFNSVDSILMVEEGFSVTSVDASDKMLKYALKVRWARRKEPEFDNWGWFYVTVLVIHILIRKFVIYLLERGCKAPPS